MEDINEADWKIILEVRVFALERFCERVLSEVARISEDTGQSVPQRYLTVCDLIHEKNQQMAQMFDNTRRSTAILQLVGMLRLDLLTDEEIARFSPETRNRTQVFLNLS